MKAYSFAPAKFAAEIPLHSLFAVGGLCCVLKS